MTLNLQTSIEHLMQQIEKHALPPSTLVPPSIIISQEEYKKVLLLLENDPEDLRILGARLLEENSSFDL